MNQEKTRVLGELSELAKKLTPPIKDNELIAEMNKRDIIESRLLILGIMIDRWVGEKKAEISAEHKLEWRYRIALENTNEYRMKRIEERIGNTLKSQSQSLRARLIEMQSERKQR